jgi:hypothetical protein
MSRVWRASKGPRSWARQWKRSLSLMGSSSGTVGVGVKLRSSLVRRLTAEGISFLLCSWISWGCSVDLGWSGVGRGDGGVVELGFELGLESSLEASSPFVHGQLCCIRLSSFCLDSHIYSSPINCNPSTDGEYVLDFFN